MPLEDQGTISTTSQSESQWGKPIEWIRAEMRKLGWSSPKDSLVASLQLHGEDVHF